MDLVHILELTCGQQKTVCVDFDGVLSSHSPGQMGVGVPLPHAMDLVAALKRSGYRVVVLTARRPLSAVRGWLRRYKFPALQVTNTKPPALAYIDDRAVQWQGTDSHHLALWAIPQR